jgi:hypothetical protein
MSWARLAAFTPLLGLGHLLLPIPLDGHESNGTPAARTLFAEGEAATKAGRHSEAVQRADRRAGASCRPDVHDTASRILLERQVEALLERAQPGR